MASPLQKVGILKCHSCRTYRQKCMPTQRIWIEGGQQDKCARCAKFGHACGPGEYAPSKKGSDSRASISVSRRKDDGGIPHNKTMHGLNVPVVQSGLRMVAPSSGSEDNLLALQNRLREIDLRQEAMKRLDEKIHSIESEGNKREDPTKLSVLRRTRSAILDTVLAVLRLAKDMAIYVEEAGNTTQAYIAYTRVLKGYQTLGMPASYEIRGTLIRMARLMWALGDDYQAQNFAWQALEIRYQASQAPPSDLEVLKSIAKSLLRTSPELSQLINLEMGDHSAGGCSSWLPPLHAMAESNYASQVPGNIFKSGFYPAVNPLSLSESPIVGGIDAVLELLGEFADTHLEARNHKKQTILHLAASHSKEGLGHATLIRSKNDVRLLRRLVNSRDQAGETVLTAAISSGCSLPFIEALIENGAEVEPSTLPLVMTPLQAACSVGSREIVKLLAEKGANIGHVNAGSSTPLSFAQEKGHHDVFGCFFDSQPDSRWSPPPKVSINPPPLSSKTLTDGDIFPSNKELEDKQSEIAKLDPFSAVDNCFHTSMDFPASSFDVGFLDPIFEDRSYSFAYPQEL